MTYYPGQDRTARTLTFLVLFLLGIGLTVGLYHVKIRAQSAKREAASLERIMNVELEAINVLKAELAYLESPERLGIIAREELGLDSLSAKQMISVSDISKRFPLVEPADQVEAAQ